LRPLERFESRELKIINGSDAVIKVAHDTEFRRFLIWIKKIEVKVEMPSGRSPTYDERGMPKK